jgi:hypothetical protein
MWKKKDKNLPRDVRTHWNSTYDMLEVAIDYRDVIDHLCSERDPGLRKFELDPEEWLIATQLRNLLKVTTVQMYIVTFKADIFTQIFKDATQFFSRSKISNLTVVIPAMDHLDKHLVTALTGTEYSPSIRSAIRIGIKTLNKYYSKMDQSGLYHISMGKCF